MVDERRAKVQRIKNPGGLRDNLVEMEAQHDRQDVAQE